MNIPTAKELYIKTTQASEISKIEQELNSVVDGTEITVSFPYIVQKKIVNKIKKLLTGKGYTVVVIEKDWCPYSDYETRFQISWADAENE